MTGMMAEPSFLYEKLLLALPAIGDPRFHHSVIALCSDTEEGAMGVGIGTVVEGITVGDLLQQFDIEPAETFDQPVHFGGPVEMRRGFVLHSLDWGGQEVVQVGASWAVSGSLDILKAIATGAGPSRWLMALGYAGWGAGQLEAELTEHAWHLADYDQRLMYEVPAGDRWASAFAGQGVDPSKIASVGGRA